MCDVSRFHRQYRHHSYTAVQENQVTIPTLRLFIISLLLEGSAMDYLLASSSLSVSPSWWPSWWAAWGRWCWSCRGSSGRGRSSAAWSTTSRQAGSSGFYWRNFNDFIERAFSLGNYLVVSLVSPHRSLLGVILLVLASLIPSLPELSLHSTVSVSLASATRPQRLCIIDLDSSLYHHLYLVLKLGGRHLLPSLMVLLAIIRDTRSLGGCDHAPCHTHGRPRPDILHNTDSLSDVEEKIFIKMQDFKVEDRARRIYRRCLGSINLFLNLLFVITELMSQVRNIPNNVNI